MSLSIYTYSNPYAIQNEPYWDSIKNCAHFCVSQTMVNGLTDVYPELNNGQIATIQELVEALYPNWFDTKTYIEQYAILTNVLKQKTEEANIADQYIRALTFNKSVMLNSVRMLFEMNIDLNKIKVKKLSEEQKYLVAIYKALLLDSENKKSFSLQKNFSESEVNAAVKKALVAKDVRRNRTPKSIEMVDCETVVIHGVHQFTPTILSAIEVLEKYKRVVLLFNYQEQYKEIYQTWLDVYACFDINIKSQFNTEFRPSKLLQASYQSNVLADTLAKIVNGEFQGKEPILNQVSVLEFDNITEFSAYVARI